MAEIQESGAATDENIETITIVSEEDVTLDNSPPLLPWGTFKEKVDFPQNVCINPSVKPGEFVLQTLFAEFTVLAQKKIDQVLEVNVINDPQNPQKPLSKFLQRGEDPNFDQLLSSLSDVAENSLPSILRTLFAWYDRQIPDDLNKTKSKNRGEKYYAAERRDLAVDFICCLVLIEVLKQLPYHPGHDDLCNRIITQAFKHFRFKEGAQSSPNAANINITSDLYAEVIGVLATSRFTNVKKRFMYEMKELRSKDQSQYAVDSIISLLMGMRFFRVKMHPIEEFQASVQFLSDLGLHFLDPKEHIKIKHALAGLFVEILLPVAAVVKTEVNVPALKNFVETLYQPTLDIANKKKHSMSLFPMVTCLLCVSQKTFFLNNWPNFLRLCLEHLKDKDNAMARIALESLYRLIWVYMIRIKCESNSVTQSRLESIVTSLFPRGSRDVVMPKDTPLNIFVKIIQFIAQEKTDYAMREIIFDLLYAGKRKGELTPERMCIGLRAFLVIADSRQQKEGEPPMPQTMGVMPSGSTLRFKKTFINKYLSEETAKHIGMSAYYPHVRKAFGNILRVLDTYVGRPRLLTKLENVKSEMQKEIPGEEKKKIDLFRTCVAAIPRLLPESMSRNDLIELLSRLTIHIDDELGKLAFQALQNIISDLPEWRNYVLKGFVSFIQKEVNDTFPQYLEQCNRKLILLLTQYKAATQMALHGGSNPGTLTKQDKAAERQQHERERKEHRGKKANKERERKKEENKENVTPKKKGDSTSHVGTMHEMEGFALVMLCSCKPMVRKHAVIILKEVRNIYMALDIPMDPEPCVLDVMDKCCPVVMERVMPHLPGPERAAAVSACHLDFQWLADRTSIIWHSAGYHEMNENNNANAGSGKFDPWVECISIFMHPEYVMGHCPSTVAHTWPMLFARLKTSYEYLDPLTMNERTSILGRPGARKLPNERDMYMNLWQNYVVMVCCIAPPYQVNEPQRCVSPDLNTSSPDSAASEVKTPTYQETARDLFKLLVPLIRNEGSDMRETVVVGLGHINPVAFSDLTEELLPIIREAIDRKVENVRKKRKRDTLRQALVRIFRIMAEGGVFSQSPAGVLDERTNALSSTFIEYIEGARLFLEGEPDKQPLIQEVKLNFSGFIRHLIRNMPVERRKNFLSDELRMKLFHLFASWSGKFGRTFAATDKRFIHSVRCDNITELELSSLQAMAAVLSCGSVFAPKELNDNGYVYPWLDTLLGAHDDKIYRLAQETIVLLLEYNPDMATMLEWVIDRCYTGSHEVADGCFNALANVFNNSEYPCDHVAMLNVTLLNISSPRATIHETAIQLFQLLYKRFFLDEVIITDQEPNPERDQDGGDGLAQSVEEDRRFKHLQETLLSGPYSRSQFYLSETLARLHPKLTMPMFSEITQRFQTAIPSVRQVMLQYLLPWLFNIELVDQNIPIPGNDMASFDVKLQDAQSGDFRKPPLKGEGWGTPQATDMVLNNLFYITAKFSDDHAKEMEDLWAALVDCWPGNLKVVMRYLIIVTSMGPTYLLEHAKRVTTYIGRAKPDRLVTELVNELHTVEALNFNVERTQTPPFYRLSHKKQSLASNHDEENDILGDRLTLDKGQIHTKRHSAEDPNKLTVDVGCQRTDSAASLRSETSMSSVATVTSVASGLSASTIKTGPESELEDLASTSTRATSEIKRCDSPGPVPYPLPMPAYGGYFAPMSKLMPEGDLPNPPYQRCNLAVMLLTDLVMDGVDIDWTVHLPLMLHIIFLGLDHSRALIHEHCKKLLLNLLLVLSAHNDRFGVARIILGNKGINDDTALTLPKNVSAKDFHYTENIESSGDTDTTIAVLNVNIATSLTPDSVSSLEDVDTLASTEDVAKALIEFLVTRKCRPLWSYEDITAKVHNIKSAEQLEHFLKYVLRIFKESVPQALLEQRWARVALQLALSCSSRHYAGRSFQIYRAMKVPLSSPMLADILSRLVETVAEEGEDMKGYVTEIMLTLECAVDNLDVDFRSIDFVRELFMSTPNLTKEPRIEMRKSATVALRQSPPHHHRSTSYSFASMSRRGLTSSPLGLDTKVTNRKDIMSLPPTLGVIELLPPRNKITPHFEEIGKPRPRKSLPTLDEIVESRHQRPGAGGDETRSKTNLSRSRSAQSLKHLQDPTGVDDKLTILSQLFWIAVSLLESDYEYEFLLAARLLDKILDHIQPDRHEYREKLDKILHQINWPNFPGVQAMLLKGCTHPSTSESTFHLLTKLTHSITAPVIDPSGGIGFPMNVIATLPFLVEHYEDPDTYCIDAADNIYKVCIDRSPKLDNLATVMNLYSRGTFGKDSMQWTKCVIKYLYDEYSDVSVSIIAFLVEVLDKGPSTSQGPILQILHCIVNHIDLTPSASQSAIISDLMRMVAKFVESPWWKEALKILKLCVTRSSSLSTPPPGGVSASAANVKMLTDTHFTSFAEAEVLMKKELPGRTLDFTFDLSNTPIIGGKYPSEVPSPASVDSDSGMDSIQGIEDGTVEDICLEGIDKKELAGWKFPQGSQTRTRDRLVNLLTSYGPGRVDLPKSPSVIFDGDFPVTTHTPDKVGSIDSAGSESSSTHEAVAPDDSSAEQAINAFDFLDNELDESEDGGSCIFNQGISRQKLLKTDDNTRERSASSNREESSDEEGEGGVTPRDDYNKELPGLGTIQSANEIALLDTSIKLASSPISGSSHSLHSAGSDMDTTDLSPDHSNASPCTPFGSFHGDDKLEDMWKRHFHQVVADKKGDTVGSTFQIFNRLFLDQQEQLQLLTREILEVLARSDIVKPYTEKLSRQLDMLMLDMSCPVAFVDGEMLKASNLVTKLTCSLLEINTSYETFDGMKRDQASEHLELLKIGEKDHPQDGDSSMEDCTEEQKIDLCRWLYKLHFQLLQLYENYCKLLVILVKADRPTAVTDLTHMVQEIKEDLMKALNEADCKGAEAEPQASISSYPMPSGSGREDIIKLLMESLQGRNFEQAIQVIKAFRDFIPHDNAVYLSMDDIECILYIYCKQQTEILSGVYVVTKTHSELVEKITNLQDHKVELSSATMELEQAVRCEGDLMLRISESSTL